MLDKILNWLEVGGLPLLFILVLLEGNPLVGSFIPGQFLVIFVGFLLSTTKSQSVLLTVLFVFIGSFLGDLIGYYMGRKIGVQGLSKFGFSADSAVYRSSKSFFQKYGIFAIILGRELNPTRAFMPFLAGSMRMSKPKFIAVAAFSCFVWSTLSIYLGYYFGNIIVDNFEFFLEFIIALAVYLIFVFFTYKKFKTYLQQNIDFVKEYSLHNVFYISFLFMIFIVLSFVLKWGYDVLFNDYFAFILIPGLYIFTGFILSQYFMAFLSLVIFGYLSSKKEFKLFVNFIWGFVFAFFYTLMFSLFLNKFLGVLPYYSLIGLVYFLFFIWVMTKKHLTKKMHYVLDVVLIVILFVMILTKFSLTGNLFMTFLSLIIGAIFCELLLVLSNFRVLDKSLSDSQSF